MRIDGLDLLAFGPFTNRRLDFRQGHEGIHVVFGANEAGKSSALRAIRNALFGIPERSPDNFIHPYDNLRVGFSLRFSNGREFSAVRRKGRQRTLVHPVTAEPLADESLNALLAGLDRDAFDRMFGLDHEGLRSGGRELTNMEGDVGAALFSAAGGLVRLRHIRDELDTDAAAIFKPKGQNQALNSAISRFNALKTQVRENRRSSRDYKDKNEQLEAVKREARKINEELRECRAEGNLVERMIRSKPIICALTASAEAMAELSGARLLREGFSDDVRKAHDALLQADSRYKEARNRVQQIEQELVSLPQPVIAEAHWQIARRLGDALGAFRKARSDLPGIRRMAESKRVELEQRLKRLRPDMLLDDYARLFISPVDRTRITAIGTRLTTAQANEASTQNELVNAEKQQADAEADLRAMPAPIKTQAIESAMTAAWAKGQVEVENENLRQRYKGDREALERTLERAGRWKGSLDQLRSTAFPAIVVVDTHESMLADCDNRLRRAREIYDDACAEQDRLTEELAGLLAVEGELPTDEDVVAARNTRDRLWCAIRECWLSKAGEVPEAEAHGVDRTNLRSAGSTYDGLVSSADSVVDRVRREHARVTQRARLERAIQAQARAVEKTAQSVAQAQDVLEQATLSWTKVWEPAGVVPASPREMREWLASINAIRARGDAIDSLEIDIREMDAFISAHKRLVRDALEAIGCGFEECSGTLAELLERCRAVIDQQAELRSTRVRLEAARDTAGGRARDLATQLESRKRQREAVAGEWKKALADAGVPLDASTEEADTWMTECMDIHAQAHQLLGPDGSATRIAHIEKDMESFVSYVADVGRQLGDAPGAFDLAAAEDRAATLLGEIEQSKAAAGAIADGQERRAAASEACRKHETEYHACKSKISALEREAGATDGEDLMLHCERSKELRSLQKEREKLEADLQTLAETQPLQQWIEAVSAKRDEDLPRRLAELKATIEDMEDEKSSKDQLVGVLTGELAAIDSGTTAVAINAQMQTTLAEIEAHAREYARLRIASQVLRRAVDAYRDQNQGEALRVASEYFAKLTQGAFSGLTIDYGDESPVIVGQRHTHTAPVRVEAMSEGTTDQLFLAMRLAFIDMRTQHNEAMPLILDDILGTFDDERAAATLRAFVDVARKTQVILFTHHKHLLEIARASVPPDSLFIQELSA